MHAYQIDEEVRTRVFLLCASLAVILSYLISLLIDALRVRPPWWFDYPSAFAAFALLLALYNRHLWNWGPLSSLRWLRIPNLAGVWAARLTSSHDDSATSLHARMIIRQTGSRISISLDAPESTSQSLSASLLPSEKVAEFELTYHYLNTPKPCAPEGMVPHYGVAVLRFSGKTSSCEGEYFSGRGRHRHGEIALTRQEQAA